MAGATIFADLKGIDYEMQQLRVLRQRSLVAALQSTEEALVPFDDREPIIYPDPEIWLKMSERAQEGVR